MLCLAVLLVCAHARRAETELRVLGGRDALPGELPYVVRLEKKFAKGPDIIMKHVCTGTVISPTWVLTAAHCVDDEDELVIRYGSVHSPPGAADTFRSVVQSNKHPRSVNSIADIALLRIEPLKLQQYGKLSSVPYISLIGLEAVAAGYGLTNTSSRLETTLKAKKPLQIVQVLLRKCEMENVIRSFCLSPLCGKKSFLCPGDSGGPTLHSTGVVGVSESIFGPDLSGHEALKSYRVAKINPVSPYLDWILSHVRGPPLIT